MKAIETMQKKILFMCYRTVDNKLGIQVAMLTAAGKEEEKQEERNQQVWIPVGRKILMVLVM
jgi:hypothetical protein